VMQHPPVGTFEQVAELCRPEPLDASTVSALTKVLAKGKRRR